MKGKEMKQQVPQSHAGGTFLEKGKVTFFWQNSKTWIWKGKNRKIARDTRRYEVTKPKELFKHQTLQHFSWSWKVSGGDRKANWPQPHTETKIWATIKRVPWLKNIIWVIGVLRSTVVSDWCFDILCGSHLLSQVVVLVSWKFKNPGERFD